MYVKKKFRLNYLIYLIEVIDFYFSVKIYIIKWIYYFRWDLELKKRINLVNNKFNYLKIKYFGYN